MNEFLDFLEGKKFILHDRSFQPSGPESLRLRGFVDSMIISPGVKSLIVHAISVQDLISISDLLAKLPNCSGVQVADFTLTEETAPYLSKIMAYQHIRNLSVMRAKFTLEACRAFAESMDPDRFSVLLVEQCDMPDVCPIYNALINANIRKSSSSLKMLIRNRPVTDEECAALSNLFKNNKHIDEIYIPNLSSKPSREIVEAQKENFHAKQLTFKDCDLVGVMPAIADLLCTSQNITRCNFTSCITPALLTELCDGLKERTPTSDLTLEFDERNYNGSMQPIASLLEANINVRSLSITATCSESEWISVIEALNKNTTVKSFSITLVNPDGSQIIIDTITNTLKVNNTLKSFTITSRMVAVLDELVTVAISRNKIESLQLHFINGTFKELDLATLCDMLKKNWKLKSFFNPMFKRTEENAQLFKELMEENYSLIECTIVDNSYQIRAPYRT